MTNADSVMRRAWAIPVGLALLVSVLLATASPGQAAEAAAERSAQSTTSSTRVVRYGPYTIPAATTAGPGTITNQLRLAVPRPCVDCYITSFTPDLVYGDGTPATMETGGAMLHHFVLANQFRRDATCGNAWLGLIGERFFASGDERTAVSLPAGYGYRVRWYDSWNLIADLMNMGPAAQTVYIQLRVTVRPSWEAVRAVRPVWLDVDQCGDSEYSIPAGSSDRHWDWNVNVPGAVVAMIGHVHGHGVRVEATNESLGGASICNSVATLAADMHHVESMSTCTGDPLAVVRAGHTVRLHSIYDSPHPADDVMGIMLGYVHPA